MGGLGSSHGKSSSLFGRETGGVNKWKVVEDLQLPGAYILRVGQSHLLGNGSF